MKRRFAKAAMTLSLAVSMGVASVPVQALAEGNYGDMIELDCPEIYPESALEHISSVEIREKVDALLATMTEEEMYSMLGGSRAASSAKGYGTGYVGGVPRLGVPVLRMWDGPKGVIGNGDYETTNPASELALASSFSEEMAYKYGQLTGTDNKATAANVQLGVQLDNVRSPFFQRSRDSLGEDPYLSSILGNSLSEGVQDQHVMTTLKHLAGYSTMFGMGDDIWIDEQTLHEVYLAPYEYIIKNKNASAVMSSYNMLNGTQTSANTYLLKTVLRDMWGFTGLTMTDWGGNKELTTYLGTDLETGTISRNNQENIEAAIAAGTMTWDDVVTAVRHTLTAMGEIGYLGLVQVKQDGTAAIDPDPVDAIELTALEGEERYELLEENNEIALESAVKGGVLLKNDNDVLPVTNADDVALIGLLSQYKLNHLSESSYGTLRYASGVDDNMSEILGKEVTSEIGLDVIGETIPAEYLYLSEDCAANGVSVSIDGQEAVTMDAIRLTTGTIDGEINQTYKNSEDGTALVNGQTATFTTYLKAPESGAYELQLLKIGGSAQAAITVEEAGSATSISGSGSNNRNNWPATGTVATDEGMDIPTSTTTVTLEAGKAYKITVTATAEKDSKDMQLSLNWFKPGYREQLRADAIEAAKTHKNVIYFAYDNGTARDANGLTKQGSHRCTFDLPEDQVALLEEVIQAAKEAGNHVIVVLNTGLPVTMDWLDDVDAVLEMWLSGQAGGKAAAQLLTGVENPSGKLPVTFPKSINDTQFGNYEENFNPENVNIIDYTMGGEGIFAGYRWYDKADIEPLYDFGYGLSYTDFAYSNLSVEKLSDGFNVTFTVENTGDVTGSEIAQIYLGAAKVPEYVQMAEYQLAAFERIEDLKPGESREVTTKVTARSLSYWDAQADVEEGNEKWVVAEGERTIYVGSSSDHLLLNETVEVSDIEIPEEPDEPEVPDDSTDKLAQAAAEAAKQAAQAAEAAKTAAQAAQKAAEASQAAAENQAAMDAVVSAAQDAAKAAETAQKAAQDAAEAAKNATADESLVTAAETAQRAAEQAAKAAEAAQKAAQDQTALTNELAEAIQTAVKAAQDAAKAAQEAVEKNDTAALDAAESAVKKAEAAQKAADALAEQIAAVKAAQDAANTRIEALKKAQEVSAAEAASAKKAAEEAKTAAAAAQAEAAAAKKAYEEAIAKLQTPAKTEITTGKKSYTVKVGKKVKIGAKATNKNAAKITYKSSNKKVAKVSAKGVIRGVKKGKAKITIKCNGVKKVVNVRVK